MLKHLFNKAIKWKNARVNPMVDGGVKLYDERKNARVRYLSDDDASKLLGMIPTSAWSF